MPKAIAAVAQWLASENHFDRLSPREQRAAWFYALLTHILLLPVTYVVAEIAPALTPSIGTYLMTHFLIALLFAKIADGTAAIWALLLDEKPRFESNGWLFAFSITLLPLLVAAFLFWSFL